MDIKTVTITERGQITLPAEFREELTGNKVLIIRDQDGIHIKKQTENSCWKMSEQLFAKDWLSKADEEAWKNL